MGFVGLWRLEVRVRVPRRDVCGRRRVFLPPDGVPEPAEEEVEPDVSEFRHGARFRERGYVGADELNELFEPTYQDRLKYVLRPDEQFGTVFTWEALMRNARDLELQSWAQVAEEEGFSVPTMQDVIRAESFLPEMAIQRTFFWTSDWGHIKKLVFRKLEIFNQRLDDFEFELHGGCREWLEGLRKFNIKCCLNGSIPLDKMEAILDRMELLKFFHEYVSIEDEPEDFQRAILLACERIEKAPFKTVVFCDRPGEITSAHEVQTKAVALMGAHKAFEFRNADSSIRDFNLMGIYNIRKLFAADTRPELEMELQRENE